MTQVGTTLLSWLNPINTGSFLACLGVFIWLASRTGYHGGR